MLKFYSIYLPLYLFGQLITKLYLKPRNLNTIHHPSKKIFSESFKWLILAVKLLDPISIISKKRKIKINLSWAKKNSKKYYLLVLQVPTDYQIKRDSDFTNMYEVIDLALNFFVANSPLDSKLLIKHHPFDRIHNNYSKYIKMKTKEYNVSKDRIKYIFDSHLPTTFKNSLGTITVNSSTGLSAIFHSSPTICLSNKAIYNLPNLTFQGNLDSFWLGSKNFKIDRILLKKYINYVDHSTQIVAPSFWGPFGLCQFEERFEISNK